MNTVLVRIGRRACRIAVLGMGLCGIAGVIKADLLKLESGDVLSGSFVGMEEGAILFDSVLLGRIRVDAERAELIQRGMIASSEAKNWVEFLAVEASTTGADTAAPMAGSAEVEAIAVAAAAEGAAAAEPETGEAKAAVEEKPKGWFADWKQQIRVGYTWESSTVRNDDLAVRYTAERAFEKSSLRVEGRYEYGSRKSGDDPKVIVRDRWLASGRYRGDIYGDKFFLQLDSNYLRDQIKSIQHEFRQNVGIGWRFLNRERLKVSLVPQVTYRYLQLSGQPSSSESLFSLSQDLRYEFNERVVILQSASASWDPEAFTRSSYDFNARLEVSLTEAVFVNIAYEFEFDYEIDVGVDRKTQRTVLMLGWKF